MDYEELLKGLTAENKLANGHSQQNYILLDAGRGKFRRRRKKKQKNKTCHSWEDNSFINSGEKESCNKRDNFNFVHLVEDQ